MRRSVVVGDGAQAYLHAAQRLVADKHRIVEAEALAFPGIHVIIGKGVLHHHFAVFVLAAEIRCERDQRAGEQVFERKRHDRGARAFHAEQLHHNKMHRAAFTIIARAGLRKRRKFLTHWSNTTLNGLFYHIFPQPASRALRPRGTKSPVHWPRWARWKGCPCPAVCW